MAKAAKKAPTAKTKPQAKKAAKTSTPKAPATKASTTKATEKSISKAATIIGMLTRSSGATITELTEATGWQAHSVHGFLSGTLRKKQEMEIDSERVDGVRRYRIAKAQ